jgi:FlaG/FlaF family flagellin (archaellin)
LKRNKSKKRAVSSIIAVILLIGVAVAAMILVYVWSMGLIGTLTGGGGQQTREQIIVDAYTWKGTTMTLYFRNVGSINVVLDAIYVGGTPVTSSLSTIISVQGAVVTVPLTTPAASFTQGGSYIIRVVTKTGGVFTFSLTYGGGA